MDEDTQKAALGKQKGGKGGGGAGVMKACAHCGNENHDESTCWLLHPELKKKKKGPKKKTQPAAATTPAAPTGAQTVVEATGEEACRLAEAAGGGCG